MTEININNSDIICVESLASKINELTNKVNDLEFFKVKIKAS